MLVTIAVVALAAAIVFSFGHASAYILQSRRPAMALLDQEGWLGPTCSMFGLLALLNASLWTNSQNSWGLLGLLAAGAIGVAALLRPVGALQARLIFVVVGVAVCVVATFVWLRLFGSPHLWLLQGDGNDTLYFYGGAQWAVGHPLYVAQDVIERSWGLGNCRQGAVIVGEGCAVYRNGVYALMSIVPTILPHASPNEVRAAASLAALCLFCGAVPQVRAAGTLHIGPLRIPAWLAMACMSLAVAISTGMVGAMANGNIGTVAGAAAIAMLLLWGITPCSSSGFKAVALGMGAAVAGHLYGEAAVYGCCIVALSVLLDAQRKGEALWVLKGGLLAAVAFFAGLNVVAVELHHSAKEISGLVTASQWRAWYLTNSPVVWFAAPFSGIQMDGAQLVAKADLLLGYCLAAAALLLGLRRPMILMTLGLALFTAALIYFLELKQYQYGEHKVLQLIGPFWVAYVCALAYQRLCQPSATLRQKSTAIFALTAIALLSLHFLWAAKTALNIRIPERSLSLRFPEPLRHVSPGDEVVIDQSAVANMERFIKQDYATMIVHIRGAQALLSHRVDDTIPPHTQFPRTNTFKRASTPDWLLRLDAPHKRSVLNDELRNAAESENEFDLVDLRDGRTPLVLAGDGWYQCESSHCWTSGKYSLEAFVPQRCGVGATLVIQQKPYAPPANGKLTVEVDGRLLTTLPATQSVVQLPLPNGWSTVSVAPDWQIRSPKDVEGLADRRVLFAALQHVNVHCPK